MNKKNILIGISGGIAVYKICNLVRLFKKNNYNVKVLMTESATKFVSPVTFETLTENKVYLDTFNMDFEDNKNGFIPHIKLAEWTDLFILAPATANIIAKAANGISDDLLSTTVIALHDDINKLIYPAMNIHMYENNINQLNIKKLKESGYQVFEPEEGELACGVKAKGRLPKEIKIFKQSIRYLYSQKLKNKKVLVTAGATIENIDPVRYITNHSSGKMGVSIAEVFYQYGADVTLITGKYSKNSDVLKQEKVLSVENMWRLIKKKLKKYNYDYVVMASAVSDYTPIDKKNSKMKKGDRELNLKLKRTRDIIKSIKEKYDVKIIGFAAESENIISNAKRKLEEKDMELILANDI